jgi:hypothetical protein
MDKSLIQYFETILEVVRDLLMKLNTVKLQSQRLGTHARLAGLGGTLLGPHKFLLFPSSYTFYLIMNA